MIKTLKTTKRFNNGFKLWNAITVKITHTNERKKIYTRWWEISFFNKLELGLKRTVTISY